MRLLLDNNLSVRIGNLLEVEGWDVVHVRSMNLHAASDHVVVDTARRDSRTLVGADTDFGALLAATHATKPSMILVPRPSGAVSKHWPAS